MSETESVMTRRLVFIVDLAFVFCDDPRPILKQLPQTLFVYHPEQRTSDGFWEFRLAEQGSEPESDSDEPAVQVETAEELIWNVLKLIDELPFDLRSRILNCVEKEVDLGATLMDLHVWRYFELSSALLRKLADDGWGFRASIYIE